jgi:hypothetical protein
MTQRDRALQGEQAQQSLALREKQKELARRFLKRKYEGKKIPNVRGPLPLNISTWEDELKYARVYLYREGKK